MIKLITMLVLLSCNVSMAFDKQYYENITRHLKLPSRAWGALFSHFLNKGMRQGLLCAAPLRNTNFDWRHYIKKNQLYKNIRTEAQAIVHYQRYGKEQSLECCQQYSIAILVHLYHIDLLDDFIEQIRRCMQLNPTYTFYIHINIPVAQNLDNTFNTPVVKYTQVQLLKMMKKYDAFNFGVVHADNCAQLYTIREYIIEKLSSNNSSIEVMFSENRGVDIGGFLLQMDQLIQKNIPHDFIIKIHTKTSPNWRKLLMSLLHIRLGETLSHYQALYSCRLNFNINEPSICRKKVTWLLNTLDLPLKSFNFSAGTMFLVSKKFTDFFKKYELQNLYKFLTIGPAKVDGMTEHAFERFFGYIIDHLRLKSRVIGFYSRDTKINEKF